LHSAELITGREYRPACFLRSSFAWVPLPQPGFPTKKIVRSFHPHYCTPNFKLVLAQETCAVNFAERVENDLDGDKERSTTEEVES